MVKSSKENPKFILYKLEPLRRLEESILKKDKTREEYVKKLFGENLPKIFSNLIFLKEEYYLLNPDTNQKDCIADTLAFNKKDRQFVIIEYKRENSTRLYEQMQSYISCLDEEIVTCLRNRLELVEILKEKKIKANKNWTDGDIIWEETKGICITPEIHKDLGHHKRNPKNKNITIIEIKFYDEKNFLYINTEKLPEWLKIAPAEVKNNAEKDAKIKQEKIEVEEVRKEVNDSTITFDDILNRDGKRSSSEVKKNLRKIRSLVSFFKKLDVVIKDHGYRFVINYNLKKVPKKTLFSVEVWKTKIYFQFKDLKPELLDKHGISHRYAIESDNDFQKLKNFFQEYKEQFSSKWN